MKLLIDTYQYHSDDTRWMPYIAGDMQHMMFVGDNSSDKDECVNRLLEKLYGQTVSKLRSTEYTITNYGSNITKVTMQHSHYHLIMQPNNSALDKYIIQEIIVDFCKKNDLTYYKSPTPFKCVVIRKADNLSEHAQFCLRRIMETTTRLCRFILVCTNPCNFILPIRSRFVQVTIPTPSRSETVRFVSDVVRQEGIVVPHGVKIIEEYSDERNIKRALWKLESIRHGIEFNSWWEVKTAGIVEAIVHNHMKNLRSMMVIRDTLGCLFISNIEADMIMTKMMQLFFRHIERSGSPLDMKKVAMYGEIFARFDCRLKNATRYILHFEALAHHLGSVLHAPSDAVIERTTHLSLL